MSLGENIKILRKTKDVSQMQLAEELGVNKSTIAHYELDNNEPSVNMLKKIAKYFNVTTDYLLDMDRND